MEKKSAKRLLLSGIVFVAIVTMTFYMLFKNNDISQVFKIIEKVDKKYLIMGIVSMSMFVLCEGLNIRNIFHILGMKCNVITGIRYSSIGFFFSSITPSATGGQPMQIYFMNRDKMDIPKATLALILELASYQIITISMSVIGFIYKYNFIVKTTPNLKILLAVGVTLNFLVFIFIIIAIFSKKAAEKLVHLVLLIFGKLKIKNTEEIGEKAYDMVSRYREGVRVISENKIKMIKVLMTTCVQIFGLNSVTFFVYKSFGLSGYSYFTVVALQAVLFVAVSAIPLPGSVGVSEGGFVLLFHALFTKGLVKSGMLLSRSISFYLIVVITGLLILIFQCIIKAKEIEINGKYDISC